MLELIDIGPQLLGLQTINYYECPACGSRYPCATAMDEHGRATEMRHTPGPMCNGHAITCCPCQRWNSNP